MDPPPLAANLCIAACNGDSLLANTLLLQSSSSSSNNNNNNNTSNTTNPNVNIPCHWNSVTHLPAPADEATRNYLNANVGGSIGVGAGNANNQNNNNVDATTSSTSSSTRLSNNNKIPIPPTEVPIYSALPLNLAVIRGNPDLVQLLLNNGANPSKIDGRGRNAITCAIYGSLDTLVITPANYAAITECKPQHVAILKILLQHFAKKLKKEEFDEAVNKPQDGPFLRGITPLCLASYLGKVELVRVLLEEGTAVDARDRNGATALMYASRDGHVAVVKELLTFKARYDMVDSNGWTAIQYGQNYPEVVQVLEATAVRKEGVWPMFPHDVLAEISSKCPSFYANFSSFLTSYYASTTNATLPITEPADLTSIQSLQQKLLIAIKHADFETLETILGKSSTATTTNTMDENELRTLLNFVDPVSGLTPLHYTTRVRPLRNPESEKILHLLIQNGADVNLRNARSGKSALHYLCRDPVDNSPAVVEMVNTSSETPQQPTIRRSQMVLDMISFLIQNGCDANIMDWDGNRALHLACRAGDYDIIKVLLDCNADPWVMNKRGKLPLNLLPPTHPQLESLKELLETVMEETESRSNNGFNTPSQKSSASGSYASSLSRRQKLRRSQSTSMGRQPVSTFADGENIDERQYRPRQRSSSSTRGRRHKHDRATSTTSVHVPSAADDERLVPVLMTLSDTISTLLDSRDSEDNNEVLETALELSNLHAERCSDLETQLSQAYERIESLESMIEESTTPDTELLLDEESDELDSLTDKDVRKLCWFVYGLYTKLVDSLRYSTPSRPVERLLESVGRKVDKVVNGLRKLEGDGEVEQVAQEEEEGIPGALVVREQMTQVGDLPVPVNAEEEDERTDVSETERMYTPPMTPTPTMLASPADRIEYVIEVLESVNGLIRDYQTSHKPFLVEFGVENGSQTDDIIQQQQQQPDFMTVESVSGSVSTSANASRTPSPPNTEVNNSNNDGLPMDKIVMTKLLVATKKRIDVLKETLQEYETNMTDLRSELQSSQSEYLSMEGQWKAANKKLAEMDMKCAKLRNEVSRLNALVEEGDKERMDAVECSQRVLRVVGELVDEVVGSASSSSSSSDEVEDNSKDGLLFAVRKMLVELDPAVLESVDDDDGVLDVSRFVNSTSTSVPEITNSTQHILQTLQTSIYRLQKYFDSLVAMVMAAKEENRRLKRSGLASSSASLISPSVSRRVSKNSVASGVAPLESVPENIVVVSPAAESDETSHHQKPPLPPSKPDQESDSEENNDINERIISRKPIASFHSASTTTYLSDTATTPSPNTTSPSQTPLPPTTTQETNAISGMSITTLLDRIQALKSEIGKIETQTPVDGEGLKVKKREYKELVKELMKQMKYLDSNKKKEKDGEVVEKRVEVPVVLSKEKEEAISSQREPDVMVPKQRKSIDTHEQEEEEDDVPLYEVKRSFELDRSLNSFYDSRPSTDFRRTSDIGNNVELKRGKPVKQKRDSGIMKKLRMLNASFGSFASTKQKS